MKFDPKGWWVRTVEFWRDTKSEMKKVSWPSRQEVIGTTSVVIISVIVLGLYLWLCDVAFYKAIDYLFTQFGASA